MLRLLVIATALVWGVVAWNLYDAWPQRENDPILYQIEMEPTSLILQADGLINHE